MRLLLLLCALFISASSFASALDIRPQVTQTEDHFPQEGVPRGELKGPFEFHSNIIADTVRPYWIFVPAQYDASSPTSLLVFQDGHRATNPEGSLPVPQVMENLIAK